MNIYEERKLVAKALYDEKRQQIIEMLQDGEHCACEIIDIMKLPQSTMAFHLKILVQSGLVSARTQGKWKYYRINPEGVKRADKMMLELLAEKKRPKINAKGCGRTTID